MLFPFILFGYSVINVSFSWHKNIQKMLAASFALKKSRS
jgi:hypothetical protein